MHERCLSLPERCIIHASCSRSRFLCRFARGRGGGCRRTPVYAGPPLLRGSGASCYCAAWGEAAAACSPFCSFFCLLKSAEMGLPNLPKCTGMRAARQELDASYGASGLTCRIFFYFLSLSLSLPHCLRRKRGHAVCMLRRRKKAAIFAPPHFLPRRRRKGKIEEWLLGSKSELACSPPPPPPPATLCGKHLCSFRSFSFYPRARVLARALLYHADACTSLVPDWRFFFFPPRNACDAV